jgi:SPP1 gp7 family putative phage head morphogenesis protein
VREKGEVETPAQKWNTAEIGEEHPFNPKLTEGLVKNYGIAAGIVDKYVNYLWGQGFYVECKEPGGEKAVQIINNFNRDVGMPVIGRAWVKEALVKPGGYLEIEVSNKKISGLKILDGKYMYVKRDKHGKILGYTQYFGGTAKPVPFKTNELVALHFNVIGDAAYGLGIVWPNMTTLNDLAGLEKDMHQLLHRKANTPLHVKIGAVGSDGTIIDMPTEESIQGVRNDLETLTNKTEWVTDASWNISTIDFGDLGDKFESAIKHDIFRLVVGFKMPETIMGSGNIAEGLADNNTEDWQRTITTMQEQTEYVLETLYRKVLQQNGIDMKVEVVWGQPTNKEKTERVQQLLSIMAVAQPALRFEAEKQLAQIIGVDPKTLETPEEQREKEENSEQPNVPEQKSSQSLGVAKETRLPTIQETTETNSHAGDPFNETATIKEWLGFDYVDFVSHVIEATRKDGFDLLRAIDEAQQQAGYLSSEQIQKLREVFIKAFEEGHSIKTIAAEIKEKVQPGDLYETNEGEKTKIISYEKNRVINIARTETTRLANLGSKEFYKNNEVKQYRWLSATGERTCEECQALNGTIFNIEEKELPPKHSQCRCSITPVIRE